MKNQGNIRRWTGPFKISDLLANLNQRPPDKPGVYLVSQRRWTKRPNVECVPLYVGGVTGTSPRFRTRIGDLIADLFGFFGDGGKPQHHSGAVKLNKWCKEEKRRPADLFLGWALTRCHRCAEEQVYDQFAGSSSLLNGNRPKRCTGCSSS
jgi:hypothetical protein